MPHSLPTITPYVNTTHRPGVTALWKSVFGYDQPRNDPGLSIDKKLAVDNLLFVAVTATGEVVGTVMAGYDGHRGWLYSVAVAPECRKTGLGSRLVRHAEAALGDLGCMKINLQLLASNHATQAFYRKLGYAVEERVSMGKTLEHNVTAALGRTAQ